ncbi:hypothetical protein SERLADRAFT_375129 [Serpula lacrymans var. lacrymans S7.9]|uniref:Uncharacterized protein n=1 Tax=Serpula lacrymans var. lacrymans (strain S7.9) TaxID=578457 RepID=F8PEE1_SERL9|nr:uncharacterized protein SERLADRAFT_375129 [Serpula lacrymans var. lacrymans S7.9]EGO18473.1 hypothetical protein SERLADRAFT_375129 [Serpula lacrymans var. lacrymans S7.9]
MDKNFDAECIKSKKPYDDITSADGTAFLTVNQLYMEHLKIAKKNKVRSTCNDHRAVNLANKDQQHLNATGIGATAYAQHGVFCPGAVVDFQKVKWIDSAIVLYNIMCQYNKHFLKRVLESPYLQVPSGVSMYKDIGLFHVYSHQDICFPRYAPAMSKSYRQEILDDHMCDSNWKKFI